MHRNVYSMELDSSDLNISHATPNVCPLPAASRLRMPDGSMVLLPPGFSSTPLESYASARLSCYKRKMAAPQAQAEAAAPAASLAAVFTAAEETLAEASISASFVPSPTSAADASTHQSAAPSQPTKTSSPAAGGVSQAVDGIVESVTAMAAAATPVIRRATVKVSTRVTGAGSH